MGFSIRYETTERISPALQEEILLALEPLMAERTWLHCEPPLMDDDDGLLAGSSKPNFMPDRDDAASAHSEGLPTGTILDLLDVLCRLSGQFNIEWELAHDYSDGPMGYIRNGCADDELRSQCAALADIPDGLPDDFSKDGFDFSDD